MASLDSITDYALNIDSFMNPVKYTGVSALEILICRLILLEPGTIETHPDMGVGLISRFRGAPKTELETLNRRITDQMNTYLPGVYGVEVKTSLTNKSGELKIVIKANDQIFAISYDSYATSGSGLKSGVADLNAFA